MGYFVSKLYLLSFAGLFVFEIHSTEEKVRNLSKTPQHKAITFSKIFVTFSSQKDVDFTDKSKQRHLSNLKFVKSQLPRNNFDPKTVLLRNIPLCL